MWARSRGRLCAGVLCILGGQLLLASAVWAGPNYALRFTGGDYNSLVENGNFVDLGYTLDVFPRGAKTIEFWCKPIKQAYSNMFLGVQDPAFLSTRAYMDDNNCGGGLRFASNGAAIATINNVVLYDTVQHIAVVDTGSAVRVYRNGQQVGTANVTWTVHPTNNSHPSTQIGRGLHSGGSRYYQGWLDEVRLWNVARTQAEIQATMKTELQGTEPGLVGYWNFNEGSGTIAYDGSPNKRHGKVVGATWITEAAPVTPPVGALVLAPGSGAVEVPRDVVLSWSAGPQAVAHDVYFGAVFADVNNASRANPRGVLVSQGQTATTYQPVGPLQYGQTYYWRIDEVNAPPVATLTRGIIWSFTIEAATYPLKNITATASSSAAGQGPEKTIDGSGLDGSDLHGTLDTTMWVTDGSQPAWIQYTFDDLYKLQEMWVWNANNSLESSAGIGAKNVVVEYSADGATWTTLAGVPPFARATGKAGYAHNTTVAFHGAAARYVKLTINGNWGGIMPQTGLSEVRFFYTPVQASNPQPTTGKTGLTADVTLSWRPGHEAVSHQVYFGTDPNALTLGGTTAQTSFVPPALNLGTTYYWRVDEVNAAQTPSVWTGKVWSFSLGEYVAIDDFESYDQDNHRIYDAWIDGASDGKSGSYVGYNPTAAQLAAGATFAETTIIHGGKQSMPLAYDNGQAPFYSEATRPFDTPQDWTVEGATHVNLWFRGYPALTSFAVSETAGKLSLTGDGTDIWNNSDQFSFAYKTLTGDGSIIARVIDKGTGTNTWAKGGVMMRASLDGGSTFADMILSDNRDGTASNGYAFQRRLVTDGAGSADNGTAPAITAPYWVKIQRTNDNFSAWVSADGKIWRQLGAGQTIKMTDPICLGLCVTSHAPGEQRTMQFDNVSMTGNVAGSWQGVQISGSRYNDPAGLYVVVEDSAGTKKVMGHPDPAAAATGSWTQWVIPLGDLAPVKMNKVQKLTIGAGDRNTPKAGAKGMLFLDDIGFGHPAGK